MLKLSLEISNFTWKWHFTYLFVYFVFLAICDLVYAHETYGRFHGKLTSMFVSFLLCLCTIVSHDRLLGQHSHHEAKVAWPKFDHLFDPKQLQLKPYDSVISFLLVPTLHQQLHRTIQACLSEKSTSLHCRFLYQRLCRHRCFRKLFLLLDFATS